MVKKPIAGNTYFMRVVENNKEKWQEVVCIGVSFNKAPIVQWYGLTKVVTIYDLHESPAW
jgi:hypothetical protein